MEVAGWNSLSVAASPRNGVGSSPNAVTWRSHMMACAGIEKEEEESFPLSVNNAFGPAQHSEGGETTPTPGVEQTSGQNRWGMGAAQGKRW